MPSRMQGRIQSHCKWLGLCALRISASQFKDCDCVQLDMQFRLPASGPHASQRPISMRAVRYTIHSVRHRLVSGLCNPVPGLPAMHQHRRGQHAVCVVRAVKRSQHVRNGVPNGLFCEPPSTASTVSAIRSNAHSAPKTSSARQAAVTSYRAQHTPTPSACRVLHAPLDSRCRARAR